eukprot:9611120-Ditylum_brightwellii.AAC.1
MSKGVEATLTPTGTGLSREQLEAEIQETCEQIDQLTKRCNRLQRETALDISLCAVKECSILQYI